LERKASLHITDILDAWTAGNPDAPAQIFDAAYSEVHRIAQRCLRNERPGHTIQPTALVNEAYLKLAKMRRISWQDRTQFFAVAARIMRQILVDHARKRGSAKRGGTARQVTLDDTVLVSRGPDPALVRLDDALRALEEFDRRKARVVEMRYFGGLSADEIAGALGVSQQTVQLDWSLAKAWLIREMSRG
jgi:RNA polymerase sigma factor (TIGR02999 family)